MKKLSAKQRPAKNKYKASSEYLNAAVKAASEKIAEAIGQATVEVLKVFGCKNKYWVPSTSIPNHSYLVHITSNGCSCECKSQNYRKKCKHIIALMDMLNLSKKYV